jgi:hypothetical protein
MDSDWENEGKESDVDVERKKMPDVRARVVSDTQRGKGKLARDWACGGLLGSAQADAGKGGPRAGTEGRRPCAVSGPNSEKRRKKPFIFLFQFFKTIFQKILKSF